MFLNQNISLNENPQRRPQQTPVFFLPISRASCRQRVFMGKATIFLLSNIFFTHSTFRTV